MATVLDKELKRQVTIDGVEYTVAVDPQGLRLTGKGKGRPEVELRWRDLLSGDAAMAVALNASLSKKKQAVAKPVAPRRDRSRWGGWHTTAASSSGAATWVVPGARKGLIMSAAKRLLLFTLPLCLAAAMAPAHADDYADTIAAFQKASQSKVYFSRSHGYAVFPTVGKGGVVVGAAHGNGQVYERGRVNGDV